MTRRPFAAVAIVLAAASCGAMAQDSSSGSASGMGEFDCVIEPKMMIKLASPESGVIHSVNVDRDKTVEKGEVVAELESNLQRIALELARLKASSTADLDSQVARLDFRNSEAERQTALHEKAFASTKALTEAVTEQKLAELALQKSQLDYKMAQVELEQAQERFDRRSVRSPVKGVVADLTIRPGEYSYEQAPLMTIAEIDPLYVKVYVPVRYYRMVHVGTVGQVMPEDPIGGVYRANVTVVDRVFDAASSTFAVRLDLPNPDYALPAGLRCRVRFLVEQAAH
jgi:RND family efflux transporter MFP subunit